MVDIIVWEWMIQEMRAGAATEGVGLEIWKLLAYFYVEDGIIALCNHVFLQE